MKKHLGKLITVIFLLFCAWIVYKMLQDNTAKYAEYERAIDSLTTEVAKLDSVHVKQDSIIVVYKDSIIYLDNVIEVEKTKYATIKEKYSEMREQMSAYNPTQVDSFFKARYNY